MRMIVVLKTNKYAIAETHSSYVGESDVTSFITPMGARLNVPKENVDYILRYTDTQIEQFRQKLREFETNEKYEKV